MKVNPQPFSGGAFFRDDETSTAFCFRADKTTFNLMCRHSE